MLTTLRSNFVHTFILITLIQPSLCFVGRFGRCESKATSFRTLYKLSIEKCMNECKRRQDCHRLNYRRGTKECTFHSASVLLTGSTSTGSDYTSCVIIQRNELDTGCVCPDGMACQPNGLCKIEECKAPISVPSMRGDISGNVLSTGSKVKVECNSPYRLHPNNPYVICNDRGDWEGLAICTLSNKFPRHPTNIEYYGCTQLEVNPLAVTYDDALGLCEPYGRLARLDTEYTQNGVQQLLNSTTYRIRTRYWIQGKRDTWDGQWAFADGVQMSHFLWGRRQPNGGSGCIAMDGERHHFLMNDRPCDELFGYICEYRYI